MQHQSRTIATRKQTQTKFKKQPEQLCSQLHSLVWLSRSVLTATPENTAEITAIKPHRLHPQTYFPPTNHVNNNMYQDSEQNQNIEQLQPKKEHDNQKNII